MARIDINKNIQAIKASHGIISLAARKMGISRDAMNKRIERSVTLTKALEEAREVNIDEMESELYKMAKKKKQDNIKLGAVKYYLSTQGKQRGYFTKIETDEKINKPLIINYVRKTINDETKDN